MVANQEDRFSRGQGPDSQMHNSTLITMDIVMNYTLSRFSFVVFTPADLDLQDTPGLSITRVSIPHARIQKGGGGAGGPDPPPPEKITKI